MATVTVNQCDACRVIGRDVSRLRITIREYQEEIHHNGDYYTAHDYFRIDLCPKCRTALKEVL